MEIAKTVAMVTGGASGLGEATARMLLGAGGRVVILDRPGSPGDALAAELGTGCAFVPADVSHAVGRDRAAQVP